MSLDQTGRSRPAEQPAAPDSVGSDQPPPEKRARPGANFGPLADETGIRQSDVTDLSTIHTNAGWSNPSSNLTAAKNTATEEMQIRDVVPVGLAVVGRSGQVLSELIRTRGSGVAAYALRQAANTVRSGTSGQGALGLIGSAAKSIINKIPTVSTLLSRIVGDAPEEDLSDEELSGVIESFGHNQLVPYLALIIVIEELGHTDFSWSTNGTLANICNSIITQDSLDHATVFSKTVVYSASRFGCTIVPVHFVWWDSGPCNHLTTSDLLAPDMAHLAMTMPVLFYGQADITSSHMEYSKSANFASMLPVVTEGNLSEYPYEYANTICTNMDVMAHFMHFVLSNLSLGACHSMVPTILKLLLYSNSLGSRCEAGKNEFVSNWYCRRSAQGRAFDIDDTSCMPVQGVASSHTLGIDLPEWEIAVVSFTDFSLKLAGIVGVNRLFRPSNWLGRFSPLAWGNNCAVIPIHSSDMGDRDGNVIRLLARMYYPYFTHVQTCSQWRYGTDAVPPVRVDDPLNPASYIPFSNLCRMAGSTCFLFVVVDSQSVTGRKLQIGAWRESDFYPIGGVAGVDGPHMFANNNNLLRNEFEAVLNHQSRFETGLKRVLSEVLMQSANSEWATA